jgi:hypothetical protein
VGFGNPTGYLSLKGSSRQRLLRSEAEYYSAISCRQVLRKASLPVITDGMFCMATSIGLDNQDLLPPFIPVMRNQDGVFGATLRKCFENSYLTHLPWAFLHSPLEEKRSFSTEDIWNSPVEWGIDNAFIHFIRNFQLPPSSIEAMILILKR